jgi:hypothetical protein
MRANEPYNLEIIFYIDEDDKESIDRLTYMKGPYIHVDAVIGPRILMAEMTNKAYELADGEIVMFAGDDIIFQTKGWDDKVREEFNKYEDKILFVYGMDGIQPPSFGTHGFLHRNWINTLGYVVPPYFVSDYCDTWINEVADLIGRKHYIDIFTEHLHFSVGKAPIDQTTIDRLQRHKANQVENLYASLKDERIKDAEKLKSFISSFSNKV